MNEDWELDPRLCVGRNGRNANVCVGEGCYGEACVTSTGDVHIWHSPSGGLMHKAFFDKSELRFTDNPSEVTCLTCRTAFYAAPEVRSIRDGGSDD